MKTREELYAELEGLYQQQSHTFGTINHNGACEGLRRWLYGNAHFIRAALAPAPDAKADERVAKIRAREQAATPGGWWLIPRDDIGSTHVVIGDQDDRVCELHKGECDQEPNAEFIAHARDDIPYLLDLVSSLQSQLASRPQANEEVT